MRPGPSDSIHGNYVTHPLGGSDKGGRHAGVLIGRWEGGRPAVSLRLALDVGGRRGPLDGPAQLPRKALPIRSCGRALTRETGKETPLSAGFTSSFVSSLEPMGDGAHSLCKG